MARPLAHLSWLRNHNLAKSSFRREVVQSLGLRPGIRIADLGCGPGYWAEYILECCPAIGRYVGIDDDEDCIQIARETHAGNTNVEFVKSCLLQSELEGDAFDLVLCFNAIGYFAKPSGCVQEMLRLVRGGCPIIIRCWDYLFTSYSNVPPLVMLEALACLARKEGHDEESIRHFMGHALVRFCEPGDGFSFEFRSDAISF